jgi:hypothetical protein
VLNTKRIAGVAAFFAAILVAAGCEVEQTQEGRLPDVDIDARSGQLPEFEQTQEAELPEVDADVAEGGQLPRFDVEGPDVDIGTREERVEVPTGIETEERSITVPDVDVELPGDDDEPRQ